MSLPARPSLCVCTNRVTKIILSTTSAFTDCDRTPLSPETTYKHTSKQRSVFTLRDHKSVISQELAVSGSCQPRYSCYMSKVDFLELFSRNRKRTEKAKQISTYKLRLSGDIFPEYLSDQDTYDEHTLRIMPPDNSPKFTIQPLSLPEKKYLHDFWTKHWEIFRAAPACQNTSEKRLQEKFDGYVSINIRRYLLKDWNNTFAGGYVSGEPEARQEREADDLRALTKSWSWLCKELGFKPWRFTIDHENENLEDVKIDVRSSPFNIEKPQEKAQEIESWYNDTLGYTPVRPALAYIRAQQVRETHGDLIPEERKPVSKPVAIQSKIVSTHELGRAEREHLMRLRSSMKPIEADTSTGAQTAKAISTK